MTALDAGALTTRALAQSLPTDGLQTFRKHWIIAVGLAAPAMADAALAFADGHRLRIAGGLVVGAQRVSAAEGVLDVVAGDYPVPRDRSVLAAQQLARLCPLIGEEDVVLVLLSNGAHALIHHEIEGSAQWDFGRLALALSPAAVQPIEFRNGIDDSADDDRFSPLAPPPARHRIRHTVIASAL